MQKDCGIWNCYVDLGGSIRHYIALRINKTNSSLLPLSCTPFGRDFLRDSVVGLAASAVSIKIHDQIHKVGKVVLKEHCTINLHAALCSYRSLIIRKHL